MSDESRIPDEREQEVFFAAMGKSDLLERAAYLDAACRGQPDLRRWVEGEIKRQSGKAILPPAGAEGSSDGQTPFGEGTEALLAALKPEEAGEVIGSYRLVEPLGEGGFGVVWMAEQERPVRRQVALKIIRLGMNSKEIIARFSQERQALAMMDHPGIAKVLDAGATPFGRPFFVMELVHGVPITEYCDEARLPVRQRLEMFMQVCYAVQHAHQKGIIHRDIKPPNVLVTLLDGLPVPKVIDFGIAKATEEQRLTELTLVTRRELMLGTPLYMSPEQTGLGEGDIDTRSDIYSLGVLLYVLLTGNTPLDPELINQSSYEEMARLVRDKELPSPTAILRGLPRQELAEVARLRQSTGARFVQTVRGDLESVCMKALEKDRRRRYASASDFAADIQRYLLNQPITARPPDRWYRARKLVSRHRQAFIVGTILFTTLVAGGVTGARETMRARASERNARELEASESHQRHLAEQAVAAARQSAYDADIALAQQSLIDGNLGRAVDLLDKHRPAPGEPDLRGFDWNFLWARSRGDPHVSFPDLDNPASALAVSPDGKRLAVGSLAKTVVADTATRRTVATIPGAAGSLAFFPDGKTLVTEDGGKIHLWRTEDWTEAGSWYEGPGPIALSPDGVRLAVVEAGGVRLRETATWKEIRFLAGAASPVAFSPDGTTLASDAAAGLTLWRVDTGKGRVLNGAAGLFSGGQLVFFHPVQALVFTRDGETLLAPQNFPSDQGNFVVRAWNTRTGQETAPVTGDPQRPRHNGGIASLALSPDGTLLATTSLDHTVCLWDVPKRAYRGRLLGHLAEVGGSTFTPDGRSLVTGDRLGAVYEWPITEGIVEDTSRGDILRGGFQPLRFSSDGRTLAVVGPENDIIFYDAATRQAGARFPLEATRVQAGLAVAISADLRVLAQGLDDGYVKVWNIADRTSRRLYVANGPVDLVALTPDGETLVTGSRGKILRTHHFRTGEETYLPFSARRVVISPDGRLLAAVSPRTTAAGGAFPAANPSGSLLGPVAGEGAPVLKNLPAGEVTPGGGALTDLAEENAANGVPLWDLRTHQLRGYLAVEVRHVLDGAFAADGRLFATAASDNTVQLWDTVHCALAGTCVGHKQVVTAVAFAYDGRNLASASEDGTIRMWNADTQRELLAIRSLGDRMQQLLFSPDDRIMAAVSVDSSFRLGHIRFYRAPAPGEVK